MKYVTKWNQRKFMNHVRDVLAETMRDVGKAVEQDARGKLLAIRDPKGKGKRYRQRFLAPRLHYVINTEKWAVTASVGIQMGTKGGEAANKLGRYVELGSRKHPPHPFLRPAVFENGDKIVALIEDGLGKGL